MNVQEVISPTGIVGNAAIASVDSVSGTKVVVFKIKVAFAKVVPHSVFVENTQFQMLQKRLKFLQGWQSIYTNGCVKFVQPNCYRLRLFWVVQVWSFRLMNRCSGTKPVQVSNE